MLKRTYTKLASQRGASLSMALFLMLVCMVVASVVLVSGTTASGRLANLARMDQQYNNVTSAIELINSELSNSTVTVSETLEYVETVNPATDSSDATYTYEITSDQLNSIENASGSTSNDLAASLASYLIVGTTASTSTPLTVSTPSMSGDAWENYYANWEDGIIAGEFSTGDSEALTFNLGVSKGGQSLNALESTATVVFDSDGYGIITVLSKSNTIKYKVHAFLVPDIQTNISSTAASTGTDETTYTITKTAKLKWKLEDVTVGRSRS